MVDLQRHGLYLLFLRMCISAPAMDRVEISSTIVARICLVAKVLPSTVWVTVVVLFTVMGVYMVIVTTVSGECVVI